MKFFNFINTTVDLNDKQQLGHLELEIHFPKENALIGNILIDKLGVDNNAKHILDSKDRIIVKKNVEINDTKLIKTILDELSKVNDQYEKRDGSVSKMMDLLED